MTIMTAADDTGQVMGEIARLARVKRHKLAPWMLDGRPLAPAAARSVLAHLRKCEDISPPAVPEAGGQPPAVASPAEQPLPGLRDLRGIPAGFYATPSATGSNDLDFWRVRVQEGGRWDGFSFARRALGGPTDKKMRTVPVSDVQQRMALQAILRLGIAESQELFATSIDRCKRCSTLLTDDVSRAYRMGPDCRAKS